MFTCALQINHAIRVPAAFSARRGLATLTQRTVLVIGGAGQLGAAVCKVFDDKKWSVISADVRPNPKADGNIGQFAESCPLFLWLSRYHANSSSLMSIFESLCM